MVRRQDLQPLGALTPLLKPDEAVRLLRKGRRAVGVLSYGWPTAGDADVTGHRTQCVRGALEERPDIEAIFWDFPSLFQHPRTQKQERGFKNGLGVVSKPSSPSLRSMRLVAAACLSRVRPICATSHRWVTSTRP